MLEQLLMLSDLAKPQVVPFEFPSRLSVGDKAVVSCIATGSLPIRFEWLKGGHAFSKDIASLVTSEDLSTIHIKTLQATHADNYTCTASNDFGSDSFTTRLRVKCKYISKKLLFIITRWETTSSSTVACHTF